MTPEQLFDVAYGISNIVMGGAVVYAAIVLRRMNQANRKPSARFYEVYGRTTSVMGQVVVAFGAGVIGNSFLGIV